MDHNRDDRYGERLQRVERATELPMLVLALTYVPVFVVGYLRDVPPDIRDAAQLVGMLIVAAFAVEIVVKVAVAQRRLAYLRANWLDVFIVFVPFLRPPKDSTGSAALALPRQGRDRSPTNHGTVQRHVRAFRRDRVGLY